MSNVPPPPPPGYGAPGYPINQREHPSGTTVLVLGILGLVVCTILSPIAWAKGNAAKKEIDAHPEIYWTNKGNITAGRICGIIGTCLLIFAVAVIVLIVAAAASTA